MRTDSKQEGDTPRGGFAPRAGRWLAAALALYVGGVAAQTHSATPAERSEALPTALPFVSPIGGYRKYDEQPVESWRQANERVGRIGGWRAYAQEKPGGQCADDAGLPPAHHGGEKP